MRISSSCEAGKERSSSGSAEWRVLPDGRGWGRARVRTEQAVLRSWYDSRGRTMYFGHPQLCDFEALSQEVTHASVD
jgi:hypothetical protein